MPTHYRATQSLPTAMAASPAIILISLSGHRTKFARIQQLHRINRGPKGHLPPLGIEAASIFELEDVRVIEHAAVRLEGAHDLVQPLLGRVTNEGQAADPATALLFCIFVMHQNFVPEATHLLL